MVLRNNLAPLESRYVACDNSIAALVQVLRRVPHCWVRLAAKTTGRGVGTRASKGHPNCGLLAQPWRYLALATAAVSYFKLYSPYSGLQHILDKSYNSSGICTVRIPCNVVSSHMRPQAQSGCRGLTLQDRSTEQFVLVRRIRQRSPGSCSRTVHARRC